MSNNVSEFESEHRHMITRMAFLLCMLDLLGTDDVATFLLTL
jgi:hypothetical protein